MAHYFILTILVNEPHRETKKVSHDFLHTVPFLMLYSPKTYAQHTGNLTLVQFSFVICLGKLLTLLVSFHKKKAINGPFMNFILFSK